MSTTNYDLLDMLRWKRPASSSHEDKFVQKFIDTVPGMEPDNYGNRWLLNEKSRTLISVHTDTVHRNSGMQKVTANAFGIVSVAESCKPAQRRVKFPWEKGKGKKNEFTKLMEKWGAEQQRDSKVARNHADDEVASHCLGADDTAGVYAALRMIEAKVPVSFVFHRDEEIGGRGSAWVAREYAGWLSNTFDRCVALDRRGTKDVIISQWGDQCCSFDFAVVLGRELGMGHKPAAGIFTDSANYMEVIPECSNISVGYMNEHTPQETLDIKYLETLIERLCEIEWDKLPTERDPYEMMMMHKRTSTVVVSGGGGRTDGWGDELEDAMINHMLMDMGLEEELDEDEWEKMILEEEEKDRHTKAVREKEKA